MKKTHQLSIVFIVSLFIWRATVQPGGNWEQKIAGYDCVTKGACYKDPSDGFWKVPFTNKCDQTMHVSFKYNNVLKGVCVPGNNTRSATLYYGDEKPDCRFAFSASASTCTDPE